MSYSDKRCCKTCLFWVRDEGADEGIESGWCHRWPPVLIRPSQPVSVYDWLQPITTWNDWCGEWREREGGDDESD